MKRLSGESDGICVGGHALSVRVDTFGPVGPALRWAQSQMFLAGLALAVGGASERVRGSATERPTTIDEVRHHPIQMRDT